MGSIDLLMSDVDRTLLTHGYDLPASVIEAFLRLREDGMKIVLASARSPQALRPYAQLLGITDLAVCFNGGWIGNLNTGNTIADIRISRSEALSVMETARQLNMTALWFGRDGVYTLGDSPFAARETGITGETLFVVESANALPDEPGKIMCVRSDPDDIASFETIRERHSASLSVVGSHWRLLEVGPKHVSKQTAIEQVSRHLGIGHEQCAAAGDAENDLEMLRWAGIAVTVDNAIEEIRRFADFVGPSCDEGGMAAAADWLRRSRHKHAGRIVQGETRNG